ncbi:STAS domain-containing protein [Rhizomonospora bruguierae]|uniref:STAS domain-containing protein n=1 Tax=Rhizomonospora bruguierae TaxID=1581705 RepID=UPI001BCDA969|nr:STAS domain-containing protein [Micromonospora sp. NBRC 107566]
MGFSQALTRSGDVARIAMSGEIDLRVHDQVRAVLVEALATAPARLELDLGGLDLIDSRGVGVLVGVHRAAVGCTVEITRLQPPVARVLRDLGVFDVLCPGGTDTGLPPDRDL